MLRFVLPLFLLSFRVVSAFPTAKRADVLLTPELDSFIQGILTEWGSPGGLSVSVVSLGEEGAWTVESKGYGNALSDGTPVDDDTMFAIGSNSKLFTALSTGLLLFNESITPRFTVESKMADIIPGWGLQDDIASSQSTVVDLLSHRTGLPRHDLACKIGDTMPELLSRAKYLKSSTSFRNFYQYTNMMYMFASYLPTALLPDSIPFTRYVKNHILDPLGLTDSTYYHDVAAESHVLAQGFTRRGIDSLEEVFAGEPTALEYWQPIVNEETNVLAGPGGLIMNGKDVATWLQALLLNGASPTTGEQVIPAEALALAAKGVSVPVYQGIDTATVYGAGLWSYSYGGYNIVEHDGSVPGFRSTMSRVPEAGLGIAVLSNDDMYGQQLTTIVKRRIMETILGLKQTDLNTETKQTVLATYAYLQNATTPRPSDPTPPGIAEPSSLAGAYTDGGYGSIELCYIDSQDSCSDILAQLPDVAEGVDGVPTLIAKWDRIWTSHILLQHFDGDLWNATALDSQAFVTPDGTPTGEYWVSDVTEGLILTAQFVIEGGNVAGFGITGNLWGSEGVAPTDEAEVFFSKA